MSDQPGDLLDPIRPGDRVSWIQRERNYNIPALVLTGRVRSIKGDDADLYAVVETDPDGRLTLPSLDKLSKVVTP